MGIRDEVERRRAADDVQVQRQLAADVQTAARETRYEAEMRELATQFGQWAASDNLPYTIVEGALRKRRGWLVQQSIGSTWRTYLAVMDDGEVRFQRSGRLDHISVSDLKSDIARTVALHGSAWPFDS
ncbi:MAG TPA: hypothetical protein VFE19_07300 [Jatrophihabitantaceae bacterium]|nr:hypothetical protein [Jatrophihabitantaceae bacterium]